MFFELIPVVDHPCCKVQDLVETFFKASVEIKGFSVELFPEWIRATLGKESSSLSADFKHVYDLLHAASMSEEDRQAVYDQLKLTNKVQELCNGAASVPGNVIDWDFPLGVAIKALMLKLYDSLDLAVFSRDGQKGNPTRQFYNEFVKANKYVCPFCGLDRYKNRLGKSREDFDHYLHKSKYPFAAANMQNLVPTCGTCNRDYKKAHDILADGVAFYPYESIPEVWLEVDCNDYPATQDFDDKGKWSVKLEPVLNSASVELKMIAWNRVYSIKLRLENEVQELCEEWMSQVTDEIPHSVDERKYKELVAAARGRAQKQSQRRIEPKQILKAAFYDFILTKADSAFVESFRRLQNARCASQS